MTQFPSLENVGTVAAVLRTSHYVHHRCIIKNNRPQSNLSTMATLGAEKSGHCREVLKGGRGGIL